MPLPSGHIQHPNGYGVLKTTTFSVMYIDKLLFHRICPQDSIAENMVNFSPSTFIFKYCHLTDNMFCALIAFNAKTGNQFKHGNTTAISILKYGQINSRFCLNLKHRSLKMFRLWSYLKLQLNPQNIRVN
jgi:hypothetical protein